MKSLFLSSCAALAMTSLALPGFAQTEEESRLSPDWRRITPFYGNVSPFEGDVDPFWRRITPFEDGSTSPFWRRITPFEGDIESFWGSIIPAGGGDIDPFWRRITPFWGEITPFMGELISHWRRITPFEGPYSDDHDLLIKQLNQLVEESEAFWGERVTAETGVSFREGFVDGIFAEFGIDLSDPSSLDGLSDADRAAFQFAWYDGLMSFSGLDHVDHWMETANWSPKLTQVQGSGADTVIGIVDFAIPKQEDLLDNIIHWNGSSDPAGGHGGAVAGLMIADHDGQGVMGIAPKASVAIYNPFDTDGTASWDEVGYGIAEVIKAGASVVNLSLGAPGATFDSGWYDVYSGAFIQQRMGQTVFVHAAGNDGLAQKTDIEWDLATKPTLIIVGSVGPNKSISGFSNTPGDACFTVRHNKNKVNCHSRLMDHFIVAPGEWILVDDGQGGVTRASGTSFAAPMVTGAIALMHDRWGWLKQHPAETAEIIFATADDIGAPGVDPVYGHGLLNITASQSPISYSMLYQLSTDKQGRTTKNYLQGLDGKFASPLLGTQDGYVTVLEDVGNTYRDFLIPLDELMAGLGSSVAGSEQQLQTYLAADFAALGTVGQTTNNGQNNKISKQNRKKKVNLVGLVADMEAYPLPFAEQGRTDRLPFASQFSLTSKEGVTLAFGNGVGAMALTGDASASSVRFDTRTGGYNPVLGLASGGSFYKVDLPVGRTATLSVGGTERRFTDEFTDPASGEVRLVNDRMDAYEARATHVSFTQALGETFTYQVSYTQLEEDSAALGTQATLAGAFSSGSTTDAATIGATWSPSDRVSLSGSATLAGTRAGDDGASLTVGEAGLVSSAYEASVSLQGVFGRNDQARIALVQPMSIESGSLAVRTGEVTDRLTGELGLVTRQFDVNGTRKLALEAGWGTPLLDEEAFVSGFVRLETQEGRFSQEASMAGVKFQMRF